MTAANTVSKNSEILFIYEARLCNPNGDPDRENKPRIDPITHRNYVTDVRLKRFFRDYIIDRMGDDGEKYIWVTTVGGKNVRADERLGKSKEIWKYTDPIMVPKYHIDARLFGATIPIGGKEKSDKEKREKGESYQIVGPVQFAIGFSLHKVDILSEVSTITSRFTGVEKGAEREYGTIGKDWRVYYSLIAFYGVVNSARARATGMRDEDVKLLDNLLWDSVRKESITRSKIGHFPHLYLRLQYGDGETLIGDLRRFIDEDLGRENVRNLNDLDMSFKRLFEVIKNNRAKVDGVFVRESEEFAKKFNFRQMLEELRPNNLPHDDISLNEDVLVIR